MNEYSSLIDKSFPENPLETSQFFEIEKIDNIYKFFQFLEIRNGKTLLISELREMIKKYNFNLDENDLINFLLPFSDEMNKRSSLNKSIDDVSITINYELFS
jgi:hypothetical protein